MAVASPNIQLKSNKFDVESYSPTLTGIYIKNLLTCLKMMIVDAGFQNLHAVDDIQK